MRSALVSLVVLVSLDALAEPCGNVGFTSPRNVMAGAGFPQVADFDEDGRPDLFVEAPSGLGVALNRNLGETWDVRLVAVRAPQPRPVASGDFDGDGHRDVALLRDASVSILLGDGRGDFRETADAPVENLHQRAAVSGDFDRDGVEDVIVATRQSPYHFWLFRGGSAFPSVPADTGIQLPEFGFVRELDAADFDRDGDLDVLVTMFTGRCGSHYLYLNEGGRFSGPSGSLRGIYGTSAAIGDFDGNGLPDVVMACFTTFDTSVRVALAGPGGTLTVNVTGAQTVAGPFSGFAADDFDGDGHLDVVMTGIYETYFLRGDGTGRLAEPTRLFEPAGILAAADIDGDGRPDLIVGGLTVRLNRCADSGPAAAALLVPIFLNLDGANSAHYVSSLKLVNRGTQPALAEGTFTRTLFGDETRRGSAVLAGGEQRVTGGADREQTFSAFGLAAPLASAWTLRLRVEGLAEANHTFALTTIRTETPSAGCCGGVSMPAVPLEELLTGTSVVGWLTETEKDRTNVALVNAGNDDEGEIVLRVTVVSTDAAHPGTATLPDVRLAPGGFYQHDRALPKSGLGAASGFVRVERVLGTARYWVWATVNDNANADGSVVPPLRTSTRAGTLTLPVLVETDTFQSELVVTNASEVARRIAFSWVAEAVDNADHTARFTLELAPGEQLYTPSFVEWLRERATPGVGPRGGSFAGALFATVEGGDSQGLFVGARTSSAGGGGRYGVFYAAVPLPQTAADAAFVYGLEQTAETRSNLALVNAGDEPDTFRIELFDGATGLLAASIADVLVPARGWRQLSSILAEHAPGVSNAYARVTRTAGSARFLAYAVVNQGAVPGQGSGDGSYIPMRPER